MQANFTPSNKLVLLTEGGYVNDKRDPGGPTNKGITLATARRDIDPTFTIAQLKVLSDVQAGLVYKHEYWDKVNGDAMPYGCDYATHDYGVNSGPGRAARVVQRIVGVPQDGVIGSETIEAVYKRDPDELTDAICAERLAFMKGLSSWAHFGAGWTNRVNGVRTHAHAMTKAYTAVASNAATLQDVADTVGKPTPYAGQYLALARDLPTGKATIAPAPGAKAGIVTGGGAGIVGTLAAIPHIGGYMGMGVAFGCVGLTAWAIAELQSKMDRAAVAPYPVPVLAPRAA